MWIVILSMIAVVIYFYYSHQRDTSERQSVSNNTRYPNFTKALLKHWGKDLKLFADNGKVITYKIDRVDDYSRPIGEVFIILNISGSINTIYMSFKPFGKPEIVSNRHSLNTKKDVTEEEYHHLLYNCGLEIS